MTDKQIIIDGVDVSGCTQYDPDEVLNCNDYCLCKELPDCYYKLWKRKEQECEKAKQNAQDTYDLWQALIESFNILQGEKIKLERECERLKDKLNCCFCNPHVELNDIEKQRKCVEVTECFRRQFDQLKIENENLIETLGDEQIRRREYEMTLAEIKPILEYYESSKIGEKQEDGSYKLEFTFSDVATPYCINYDPKPAREALRKINEVENEG